MKRILLFVSLVISNFLFGQTNVTHLLVENKSDPNGVETLQPRFSWQLQSDQRNVLQTAYEIVIGEDAAAFAKVKKSWSSGKVLSAQSVYVPYSGNALTSGNKYVWQVRVWDGGSKPSNWSKPAWFRIGLLQQSDWKAKWIEAGYKEDSVLRPSPLFRKAFSTSKKVKTAIAYITSHGMYEAFINGNRVGDIYLTPGWTSYNKRLQYQQYDVTNLLYPGANAIGVMLGSGWYRGSLAWDKNKDLYGKNLALLLQLHITYADGTTEVLTTDESWKSSTGAIIYSEIYNGETQDARKEKSGWATPNYNETGWSNVLVRSHPTSTLIAMYNEGVGKHETFVPIKMITTPKGEKVIDFGQNLVGWVQLTVSGKVGDKIILSHAEVLDKAGNFYTDNLRAARQQNEYILKGGGQEVFEPHFTWQGFRYVKVEGYPGELKPENFTAVALYSDMKPTGQFTSSNALLNQLQHNIQWGQKGNFVDVPTDCPQRDERLGWTGDAQAFSRTAAYNMNVNSFFAKWLKDVAADQQPNGSVPFVVPNVLGAGAGGSAGWSDAATIVPWNMYMAYGDKNILVDQYASMKSWVGYMKDNSTDMLWNKGFHFGDWLFYRPNDDLDGRSAVTDKYLISQCFYAHSVQLLINAAEVLGKADDIQTYASLLKEVKKAFMNEYMTSNGRMVSGTQTAYVLALNFDMLPEAMRAGAAKRLADNVESYDNHLTTGFLGTPYLCHVLSRFGYDSIAYKLLLQETYPSWLYPVKMGATTIWERWDGQKPDSTFQNAGMNSFNHYAYGAIGDWMYRVVAGLQEAEAGYKKIMIKPHIGGGLTSVEADLETYYGLASSHWKKENSQLLLDVNIPPNTRATVYIPALSAGAVTEGGRLLSSVKEIKLIGQEGNYTRVEVGSGSYHFAVK